MNNSYKNLIAAICSVAILTATGAFGGPDQYIGDSAIYGGDQAVLQPNVLLILDNSGSMGDGMKKKNSYSAATTYDTNYVCKNSMGFDGQACQSNIVYLRSELTDSNVTFKPLMNVSSVPAICSFTSTTAPCKSGSTNTCSYSTLSTTGMAVAVAPLNDIGTCCSTTLPSGKTRACTTTVDATLTTTATTSVVTYYTGNYINSMFSSGTTSLRKIDIAKAVLSNLVQKTDGARFGVMTYAYKTSTSAANGSCQGGTGDLSPDTICSSNPRSGSYGAAGDGIGGTFLSSKPLSTMTTSYISTLQTMTAIFDAGLGVTNRAALADTIMTINSKGFTPLGETLYEGMRYYQGGKPAFATRGTVSIGATGGYYTSPITNACQNNYAIVISDGDSTADDFAGMTTAATYSSESTTSSVIGCTAGSCSTNPGSNNTLSAVAKWMYEHDMKTGASDTINNNVQTYTIGFNLSGSGQTLLTTAADATHGRGAAKSASSASELSDSLEEIINQIFSDTTSYVAPVVPVSPQNRTYIGSRVYMGFFKPQAGQSWQGNVKKFATSVDSYGTNIIGRDGVYATYVDANGDNLDDRDSTWADKAKDGTIRSSAKSYWTTTTAADGKSVTMGGVGGVLQARPFSIGTPSTPISSLTGSVRNIYTYMRSNPTLTDASNAFLVSNTSITAGTLGLPGAIITGSTSTDIKKLINYVHGIDVYSTASATYQVAKRSWLLGDVLHSKPIVVSYGTYTYSEENTINNKSMIFVGTNDGLLHAFRDNDGTEAWAFIPPSLLPNLQYLVDSEHTYFVDGAVTSYIFDANNNGTLEANDKVIIIVGLRRGAGSDSGATGYYYALDVTDPYTPKWLWEITPSTAVSGGLTPNFSVLGESWSEPKIARINNNGTDTMAMIIGGGYDNCHEDGRYGHTQLFTAACLNATSTADGGLLSGVPIMSSGTIAASALTSNPTLKGNAVYVVELGRKTSATTMDITTNGGKLIKSFSTDFAVPSEVLAMDTKGSGYTDRLYVGDLGGNLYRMNLSDSNPANWPAATKLFTANSSGTASDAGKKIFYRPAGYVDQRGNIRLYFGTGDREHPLNRGVIDRLYEVIDKPNSPSTTHTWPVSEAGTAGARMLLDVTADTIQTGTIGSGGSVEDVINKIGQADDPNNTTYYGWYIKLDGQDWGTPETYPGEKSLAAPALSAGAVYFTTFSPIVSSETSTDPCKLGSLGTSYLYVVDYDTGMALNNYYTGNDSTYGSYSGNKFANPPKSDFLLARRDRRKQIGDGIPSGAIVVGDKVLVGCGAGLCTTDSGSTTVPPATLIYWRMK